MRFAVLLVGVCGVASAALIARYGLTAGASPVSLSAWRLVLASIGLIVWQLVAARSRARLQKEDIWRVAVAGIFLAIHFATWIASLEFVSVARSTLLVSTSPLWAGLVGLFIPALRPGRAFWIGLFIAGAGTALITLQDTAAEYPKGPAWVGDVLALIGAIAIVPYLLLSQDVQRRAGTLTTITWIYGCAAAFLLLYLLATGGGALPSEAAVWLSVAGMAVFAQLIGHSFLNLSLKSFSAAQVATATLLEPVFAAILAWGLLAERISLGQAIGGAILLFGVGVSLGKSPSPDAAATPTL